MLRAVAFGSRLLPTRPVKDFHLQSSAHAGHTKKGLAVVHLGAETGEENHRLDVKGKLSAMKDDLTGFAGKVQLHQRAGNVHVEILDLADVVAADLIVVGAYGQELKDYHLGPKAARIARHATCSVYIARP